MMQLSLHFEPEFGRADLMNMRMYRELAGSLRYIMSVVQNVEDYDSNALLAFCAALDDGVPPSPLAFAYYYALVRAIEQEDWSASVSCFADLAFATAPQAREIVAFGQQLGLVQSAVYRALVEEGEPLPLSIAEPSLKRVAEFRSVFAAAMELIEDVAPALANEVNSLAKQIVLVGQSPKKEADFDGGSHFQLWNALFLNVDRPRSRVKMAEVIAHESAHSLLFGFCTQESLTLNSDAERFASPLREDSRPMDGIFHATFVSARMHWLLSKLIRSDRLDSVERAEAERSLETDRRNFTDGYDVIQRHGRLTQTGSVLLQGAVAYMQNMPLIPAECQV